MNISLRLTYLAGFLAIAALLASSIYLQIYQNIMPCPLCTLQRISFFCLGLLFLSGIFLHAIRAGRLLVNSLASITALLGVLLAGRQVWLQHFPPANSGECGVSLQYMLQILPINEVMQKIFSGTAECTQRGFEFLHFNIAEWALIWFIGFLCMTLYLLMQEFKR